MQDVVIVFYSSETIVLNKQNYLEFHIIGSYTDVISFNQLLSRWIALLGSCFPLCWHLPYVDCTQPTHCRQHTFTWIPFNFAYQSPTEFWRAILVNEGGKIFAFQHVLWLQSLHIDLVLLFHLDCNTV